MLMADFEVGSRSCDKRGSIIEESLLTDGMGDAMEKRLRLIGEVAGTIGIATEGVSSTVDLVKKRNILLKTYFKKSSKKL